MKINYLLTGAILFFILLGIYMIYNAVTYGSISKVIDFGDKFTNLPNYLVFIVTGISACLLYITLNDQRKANEIAEFENRFFKFIDYHRENVSEIRYRDPNVHHEKFWTGIQVFNIIHYEVLDILKKLTVMNKNQFKTLEQKKELINFAYSCVFYGAGEKDGIHVVKEKFKNNSGELEKIRFVSRMAKYGVRQKYYTGHVNRLGRYFRNLYQAIMYVENQDFLDENQKYEYVKHLRAQLSPYEQVLLFYNSLSDLGKAWEYEYYDKYNTPITKGSKKKLFKKLLITKYDLIRNTLFSFNGGNIVIDDTKGNEIQFSIKEFYPLLNLESEEECSVSGVLPFKNAHGNNEKKICRFCFNEKYIGYETEDMKEKIKYIFAEGGPNFLYSFDINNFCNEKRCLTIKEIKLFEKHNCKQLPTEV